MMKISQLSSSDRVAIIFFVAMLLLGFFLHFKDISNKNIVLANYHITVGSFEEYNESGGDGNPYIVYSYTANGKVYKRLVSPKIKFQKCLYKDCTNKRFWVIYSSNDPSLSLIDLTTEIQGIANPKFPKTLDNFR